MRRRCCQENLAESCAQTAGESEERYVESVTLQNDYGVLSGWARNPGLSLGKMDYSAMVGPFHVMQCGFTP